MTYRFIVTADVTIEAENIMQATEQVRKIRVIGSRMGLKSSAKWATSLPYRVDISGFRIIRRDLDTRSGT